MSPFFSLSVSADTIRAACDGNARAHEEIFRACQQPVYTLIRRLIPRAAVADDLLQDTFVELLRNIRSYSGEGSFGGWVRSIAVSKCLMYLRSPWHRSFLSLDHDAQAEVIEQRAGPDLQMETQADLLKALSTLPALTRTVVWLHDVEGYTHGEIAELLGRSTSFSKSQLARAHVKLRDCLQAEKFPAPSAMDSEQLRSSNTPCASNESKPMVSAAFAPVRE